MTAHTATTATAGLQDRRTALLAAWQTVLDIAKTDDALELPELSTFMTEGIRFGLWGEDADRQMRFLEDKIPCELTGGVSDDGQYWDLRGTLNGIKIKISARVEDVADKKVVGLVEQVEWTRRPAPTTDSGEAG